MIKLINEGMNVTDSKTYNTKFGPFIIVTKEGKARRRNWSTGKVEWQPTRSRVGYFENYPLAVEFFLYKDGPNKYVSSSQGRDSGPWVEFIGTDDYQKALNTVDEEVVKCFQDYYGDPSIY